MTETIIEPRAISIEGGVDLLLPSETPLDALEAFVASCNIGECGCGDSFVARVAGVELFKEPGRLRVRITGDVTPDEVLAEMTTSSVKNLA